MMDIKQEEYAHEDLLDLIRAYDISGNREFWCEEAKLLTLKSKLQKLRAQAEKLGGDVVHPLDYLLDLSKLDNLYVDRFQASLMRRIVEGANLIPRDPGPLQPKHIKRLFEQAGIDYTEHIRNRVRTAIKQSTRK